MLLYPLTRRSPDHALANSEVQNDESYGVLKLTLRPKGYEWRFLSAEGGEFTDSGSARCH